MCFFYLPVHFLYNTYPKLYQLPDDFGWLRDPFLGSNYCKFQVSLSLLCQQLPCSYSQLINIIQLLRRGSDGSQHLYFKFHLTADYVPDGLGLLGYQIRCRIHQHLD